MSDRPRVSVLMTVYNGGEYLRAAVDSVLAQTFDDWELIVVDNASTDGSREVLSGYDDSRIRVERLGSNIGRTPALRHAFSLARGGYIAVLDADDLAHPTRLAKEVAFLDARPDVLAVGSWVVRIDAKGREIERLTPPTDPDTLAQVFGWTNPLVHSSAMFRADAAVNAGGYPDDMPYAQDAGLWLRLLRRGRIAIIDEFLCSHRTTSSFTRAARPRPDVARDNKAVLEYARAYLPLGPEARRRNREELTIAEIRYALSLLYSGRAIDGIAEFARAVVVNPSGALRNRVVRSWLGRGTPASVQ